MSVWIVMLNGWPVSVYLNEQDAMAHAARVPTATVCPVFVTGT